MSHSCSELTVPAAMAVVAGAMMKSNEPGTALFAGGVLVGCAALALLVLPLVVKDPAATLARMKAKQAALMTGAPAVPQPDDVSDVSRCSDAPEAGPRNRAERRALERSRRG